MARDVLLFRVTVFNTFFSQNFNVNELSPYLMEILFYSSKSFLFTLPPTFHHNKCIFTGMPQCPVYSSVAWKSFSCVHCWLLRNEKKKNYPTTNLWPMNKHMSQLLQPVSFEFYSLEMQNLWCVQISLPVTSLHLAFCFHPQKYSNRHPNTCTSSSLPSSVHHFNLWDSTIQKQQEGKTYIRKII